MKYSRLLSCTLLLLGTSLRARAAVTATLDRDHVNAGDSVQLVLLHDGRSGSEPDLEPLKKDFDVLGTSSGTTMQFTNGHFTSQVQLQVTLSPRHEGTLTIPALQWDGDKSEPLQLTVGGGASGNTAASNSPHVFIETSLDQPKPYVQGAATLTVRIYADQQLYQGALELQGSSDIAVQLLGKDQQGSEMREGHRYQVIQRQYLLQPQRSGHLSLDGPVLDAQVETSENRNPFGNDPFFSNSPFAGMMRSTRPLHVHGKPVELDVRPRPASMTGNVWLPASDVTLGETWKPDNLRVHVGEPLTRHLQLKVIGATGAQLPDLSTLMNLPEGLKAYPDQPRLDTTARNDTVAGTREQDIALIAQRPGHYELPAIHLAWWDTKQDAPREAVLPARSIDILPAEGSSGTPAAAPAPAVESATGTPTTNPGAPKSAVASMPAQAPATPASSIPWPWISLALGLLWLSTLAAWWWQVRRSRTFDVPAVAPPRERPPDLRKAQAACRSNHPGDARRTLLDWARQRWPEAPPLGLKELASRAADPALSEALKDLDRACYRGGDWNGETLARALGDIAARQNSDKGKSAASDLAPLYP